MNVLITGTSRGLGFELAELYLARGDQVFGISRSSEQNQRHPNFIHFSADVANEKSIVESKSVIDFDSIDLIINNALFQDEV